MKRRDFIKGLGLAAAGCLLGVVPPGESVLAQDTPGAPLPLPDVAGENAASRFVRPALFWEPLSDGRVQCRLCPNNCTVGEGGRGRCRVRENRGGRYRTLVYGRAAALNNDPIEKKPFNHFRPGSLVLSAAAAGCNLSCKFCQNWQISQFPPEEIEARYLPPEALVRLAVENSIPNLAFTYAEPTVGYEYMYDTFRLGKEAGLGCVVVSNGFINPEAVKQLAPFLAAYKVDLKAFTDAFYRDLCGGRLTPVLDTLETLASLGLWLEIVNLVLPTANDAEKDITAMARWIKANLGPDVPLHFTRFRPMYRMQNLPPTPVATLEACHDLAKAEGLRYPYIGNAPGHPYTNTLCHNCGRTLIRRTGLWAVEVDMRNGQCPNCRTSIPGVWS